VFSPISAILGFLFLPLTLPHGMRLIELPPASADTAEIVIGYDEPNLTGLASTAGARTLLFNSFAVGGEAQVIEQQDRSAIRFTIPRWAFSMVAGEPLASFFVEVPKPAEASTPAASPIDGDFRSRVEEEIRSALLANQNDTQQYATDDAFVAISAPITETLKTALSTIPRQGTPNKPLAQISRLPAERTLHFRPELPMGAVIFAAPIPSVYYREWYTVLLLDRVIHGNLPMPVQTALVLSTRPYYYRIELSLAAGQFPEPAQDNFLQELQRLQLMRLDAQHLAVAKKQASDYLDSKDIGEWFASRGISDRLLEGMEWVQSTTADDVRAAIRDLLLANRVIATWPPRPIQTQVEVENLSGAKQEPRPSPGALAARRPLPVGEVPIVGFPPHADSPQSVPVPERLPSGVSLVASTVSGVFVSGGTLTKYDHEPDADTLRAFQKYAANRILVLTPASSLRHQRELWSAFKGSDSPETSVPKGRVSSGDLPAVYVLKTMLDLRVIEAGWWHEVELRIDASEGSMLQIRADEPKRQQILQWIKDIAAHAPADKDFTWMQEVAIHRFDAVRPDIQALTWERDPQGTIQEIQTIVPRFVQDVAQVYF
jgi:hypothetical protein